MKSPEPILLSQPLRRVELRVLDTPTAWLALLQQREEIAYTAGLRDGERKLSEQLLRQRGELLQLQNGVLASLQQAVPQVIQQTEQALLQLTLEVAQKLVAEIPITPEMVDANVRSALAHVEEATEFFIHLHAEDLAILRPHSPDLFTPPPNGNKMHFQASPEVSRGGCLVQTRFGIIDTRRETRLELVKQSLIP